MRISEFCGLTMKDIDFENHLINVDHQLIRTPDMVLHVQETKTSAGKRKLPMTKEVEDCFRAIVDDRNAEKPVAEGDAEHHAPRMSPYILQHPGAGRHVPEDAPVPYGPQRHWSDDEHIYTLGFGGCA